MIDRITMGLRIKLLLGCLFTLGVLAAHLSCQDSKAGTPAPQESVGVTTEQPTASGANNTGLGGRLKSAFFKLIDFKSFKAKFNKHYGTLTEELARHKLFLARHLKAKLSIAAYQLGLSTSHAGINRMSDWTQEERDQLKNKLETKELPRTRKRRSVEPAVVVVASTDEVEMATVKPMSEAEARRIGAIRDVNLLDRGVSSFTKALKKVTGGSGGSSKKGPSSSSADDHQLSYGRKSGGVRVDLRKTNCFNKPRHQGLCGSCYVFAALAQYEFMYCLAYGKKIKFSEQFIVDCGPAHLQMRGCEGGTPEQVAQFAHVLGLQKHSEYPYTADQGECLLPSAGEDTSVVYAKTRSPDTLVAANVDDYEYWLKKKVPLYISFSMGDNSYYDYAGGIDDPTSCGDTGHAMLVVGAGSDEKHGDYFILRNSLGSDWGRSGYYYVYKHAPCWRFGGAGYAPEGLRYKGRHAFTGVKSRRHEVDDDEEKDELHDEQPLVVHAPKAEAKPQAHREVEEREEGHYNFDSDDDDDHDEHDDEHDDDGAESKKEETNNHHNDDHEEVGQERTWTAAPPPKFEWKTNDHAPKYNPYQGLESNYEYKFDNDNDLYFTGAHSGYRGHNGGYNQPQQPQQVNYNGYENYGSYFDRYE